MTTRTKIDRYWVLFVLSAGVAFFINANALPGEFQFLAFFLETIGFFIFGVIADFTLRGDW